MTNHTEVAALSVAPAPARARRRRVAIVAIAVVIAVLVVAGWLAIRGGMAASQLQAAARLEPELSSAVASGDLAALSSVTTQLHDHAARAADLTSDPIWRATEAIPAVGANTAAVRVLATSVRDISAAAEPALAAATRPAESDSAADLSRIRGVAGPLGDLADTVARAEGDVRLLPTDSLIGPLRSATERIRAALTAGSPVLTDAAGAARVLPGMLGADGDRTLLVMVQNSAEVRTGGGITGSFIAVHAEGGRLQVVNHVDSNSFPRLSTPIAALPTDLTSLYGDAPGRFVMNATMTADFDLSARLATAWWQSLGNSAPDAVVAVDPSVLAALLDVTGPLALSDGTVVDRADVVNDILVLPYLDKTPSEQTALQTDLTDTLFSQLTSAPIDPLRWVKALGTPAAQGRISVWSAHADEQSVLEGGPMGGTLARFRAAGADAVGVYFNDATTGKMDTYLHTRIAPMVTSCRADGAAEVSIAVTLRSDAPANAGSFSASMIGAANPARPGDITTDVTTVVPAGWFFAGVTVDGTAVLSTDVDGGEFPASLARVTLEPGASQTVTFRFLVKGGSEVRPTIVHTPMMNDVAVTATALPSCG